MNLRYLSAEPSDKLEFLRTKVMGGEVSEGWNPYVSANDALQMLDRLRKEVRLEMTWLLAEGAAPQHIVQISAVYQNNHSIMNKQHRMGGAFIKGTNFAGALSDAIWEMMSDQACGRDFLDSVAANGGE